MGRATVRVMLLLAAIGTWMVTPSQHDADASTTRLVDIMPVVAESFLAADRALVAGDLERAGRMAERMRQTLVAVGSPETDVDPGCKLAADVADVLGERAAAGDEAGSRLAFERLRQACVRCHVKPVTGALRADRLFPATENTVTGIVRTSGTPSDTPVVVFLEGGALDETSVRPVLPAVLRQGKRQFEPRVLPIVQGTTVTFPNDDTIFHNVFSLSRVQPFDLGIYRAGESRAVTFERTGLSRVYCNIHPQMAASILVLPNAHFDVTDAAGRYVLPEVPDGSYVLRAWHELGEARIDVQVAGGAIVRVDPDLHLDGTPTQHRNKHGKPYSTKY